MSIFKEKSGITRRQFLKGSGILAVTAIFAGVLTKMGFNVMAANNRYIEERTAGLYTLDESMAIRKSHENPEIVAIYKDFLSPGTVNPLSDKAHHLLHTRYGNEVPSLVQELADHAVA